MTLQQHFVKYIKTIFNLKFTKVACTEKNNAFKMNINNAI